MNQLAVQMSPQRMFPQPPVVTFRPEISSCSCSGKLKVLKTHRRSIATLEIGPFCAHETIMHCEACDAIYASDELGRLVPRQGKFGFDVMVHAGESLFLRCRNEKEIQQQLMRKNIKISTSEIGYLGRRFIIYLALAHREGRQEIKRFMSLRGGYILHLDGTCEGKGPPHLMSGLDEIVDIVLGNVKLPSEKAELIAPFLKDFKRNFGDPLAAVHDMSNAICSAIQEVFPGVPDYICHYHFLRDLGNDLFELENSLLRGKLREHGTRSALRETAKKFKEKIGHDPHLVQNLDTCLHPPETTSSHEKLDPTVTAYAITLWVLDWESELGGFGFPFDRTHLTFYQRLQEAYNATVKLKEGKPTGSAVSHLRGVLSKTLGDRNIQRLVDKMQKKVEVFERLREAMRIALPEEKKGLNDDGKDEPIQSIKERVTAFRNGEDIKELASHDDAYGKMLSQLDKYWDKLFADPIQVHTPSGTITIQPQRTNNILERFFRDFKRRGRKRTGTGSLSRMLRTMLADTPLVKNLENSDYMRIILNGKSTLAERFAEIDIQLVREELQKQEQPERIPLKMKKLLREPNLLKRLLKMSLKRATT